MKAEPQLLDRYLDGELTPDEERRLAEWLAADAEHIRQFVRETSLHRQIRESMLARPYHAFGMADIESARPKARPSPVRALAHQLGQLSLRFPYLRKGSKWRSFSPSPQSVGGEGRGEESPRHGNFPSPRSSPRSFVAGRGRNNGKVLHEPQLFGLSWSPALRGAVVLTACLLVLAGLGAWWFGAVMGEPVLADVKGADVSVERGTEFVPAVNGMVLQAADILHLGTNATATIDFGTEQTRLELNAGTELNLASLARGKRFLLQVGRIEASVARQRPFQSMIITTPQAEARVLGTKFSLLTTPNTTHLDVVEGQVRFTRRSDMNSARVGAGQYADAATNSELAALPFTGTILREYCRGINGNSLYLLRQDPRFLSRVDGWDFANSFELAPITTNQLVVRFRGYLHPPVTGDYEFWLAGATEAQLFMSPTDREEEKTVIAQVHDASAKTWDAPRFGGTSRWCPPMPLVAGRRYYIEALVLIKHGEGHLSVAWKGPDSPREVVTGKVLSPYKPKSKEKKL